MKKVRIIPPVPKEYKKLKVAAYCRVSTSGAYFGDIRTLISETSGQHIGIIRTAYRKHPDTLPG